MISASLFRRRRPRMAGAEAGQGQPVDREERRRQRGRVEE